MSQNESEEERMLIVKAKNGDSSAYETLVRKYQRSIYYLCHRMTGAHQSADDLSQETFVKAYFALPKFNEEMSFIAWIRKIAVNSTLNYLKLRKREKPLIENNHSDTGNPGSRAAMPEQKLEQKRMEQTFRDALHTLPAEQRAIFILKVYEEQSYKDIAQTLNIPHGTVMSRLSRARQKLKLALAAYLEGGDA
ncbi:MAG: sigma-70 family RNA polymerase sigma factor [Candidatus Aminicenantaceae bacterium]